MRGSYTLNRAYDAAFEILTARLSFYVGGIPTVLAGCRIVDEEVSHYP